MFDIYKPDTYDEIPEGYACVDDNIYFKSLKDNHFLTLKENRTLPTLLAAN